MVVYINEKSKCVEILDVEYVQFSILGLRYKKKGSKRLSRFHFPDVIKVFDK